MFKTIIKEAGIIILLIIAIALVLTILFYDYIPSKKVVPIKIQAYNIPDDIKEELKDSIKDEQNIVRTYYIDNADLDLYESTNDYDKGKANPFAEYTATTENTNNTTNTNSTNNTNNNTGNNTNDNTNKNTTQNQTKQNEEYITTPGKTY